MYYYFDLKIKMCVLVQRIYTFLFSFDLSGPVKIPNPKRQTGKVIFIAVRDKVGNKNGRGGVCVATNVQ